MTDDEITDATEKCLDALLAQTGRDVPLSIAILADAIAVLTYATESDEGIVMARIDKAMESAHHVMKRGGM